MENLNWKFHHYYHASAIIRPLLNKSLRQSSPRAYKPFHLIFPPPVWPHLSSHIPIPVKSATIHLGVLYRFRPIFYPSQMLAIYKGLAHRCIKYASHVKGTSFHQHNTSKHECQRLYITSVPFLEVTVFDVSVLCCLSCHLLLFSWLLLFWTW